MLEIYLKHLNDRLLSFLLLYIIYEADQAAILIGFC